MLELTFGTIFTLIANFACANIQLTNNTNHIVILGKEQTIVFDYNYTNVKENATNTISIKKLGSGDDVRNFCVIKKTEFNGKILLHFAEAKVSNLGRYFINSSAMPQDVFHFQLNGASENRASSISAITTSSVTTSNCSNSALPDWHWYVMYASPAASLLVCIIVIVTSCVLVRKRTRSFEINKQTEKDAASSNALYTDAPRLEMPKPSIRPPPAESGRQSPFRNPYNNGNTRQWRPKSTERHLQDSIDSMDQEGNYCDASSTPYGQQFQRHSVEEDYCNDKFQRNSIQDNYCDAASVPPCEAQTSSSPAHRRFDSIPSYPAPTPQVNRHKSALVPPTKSRPVFFQKNVHRSYENISSNSELYDDVIVKMT